MLSFFLDVELSFLSPLLRLPALTLLLPLPFPGDTALTAADAPAGPSFETSPTVEAVPLFALLDEERPFDFCEETQAGFWLGGRGGGGERGKQIRFDEGGEDWK